MVFLGLATVAGIWVKAGPARQDQAVADSISRSIPAPRTNHPGNIFLAGEEVVARVPDAPPSVWRVMDYDDRELSAVRASGGNVNLGRLPVGFYRLRGEGGSNWISCAVLAPLQAPTPLDSPVGLDVAMAWFYPAPLMNDVASLCTLAGMNWTRDRLNWREVEPEPEKWSGKGRYDDSALAQSGAGLNVLQVNHISPPWANPVAKRFPLDLRHAYRFYREMARRWHGKVRAFEPWNEADIDMFGGHTGSEMASLQKAAYLGLKAGDPGITACLNVFALHNRAQLADLHDNEAWPYFDTFNLHHYAPFDDYPKLYADFRAVSAGRPLWVSECALPVKWSGSEALKEPSDADLRVQAERVAKTFPCSLHEGSRATLYFMLPHYVEGQTQFGLLRPDLTPRPGYVALAAVGRFLAGAEPRGRLAQAPDTVRGFVFRARPDGVVRDVLVSWTVSGQTMLRLRASPVSVFDHLGRQRPSGDALELSPAPIFAILPTNATAQLALQPPPQAPPRLPGEASPVVLQALWPEKNIVLRESAYRISSRKAESVPLFVYNFSDSRVKGRLRVATPAGWRASTFDELELAPQSRAELRLELDCRDADFRAVETVRVTGSFGLSGNPALSMRLVPEPGP